MPGKINNYAPGAGGVNLVKNPLQLDDAEVTQAQNADIVANAATGGRPIMAKRGGVQALTSALAGDVSGMVGLPLATTYVSTLYVGRGNETANTFGTSTDGTTFALTSAPILSAVITKQLSTASQAQPWAARTASFRNKLFYAGNDYTRDFATPTNGTAPPINLYNGTDAVELLELLPGPSSDGSAVHNITDMIVANGVVYISTFEPTSTAPNLRGRVLSIDLSTGQVTQVASAFGPSTGQMTGGAPGCLCWFQGKLWVSLVNAVGTASVGKIVWAYPGVSTEWTADVSNLSGPAFSIAVYKGQLYAGLDSTTGGGGSGERVMVRSNAAGTWSASDAPGSPTTSGRYDNLIVYNDELYAHHFSDQAGTDLNRIRKFDGTTWTTDRDLVGSGDVASGSARYPLNAIVFNSALFFSFPAALAAGTDGLVMKKAGGTWSQALSSYNTNGMLGILVQRT